MQSLNYDIQKPNRNLVKDAKILKDLIQIKSMDKKSPRNTQELSKMSRTITNSITREKKY